MLKQDGVLLHLRCSKTLFAASAVQALQQVTAERKPACSHGDTLTTVVYKNYIPLCTVIAVGIGIYMFLIDLFMLRKRSILLRCKASCNLSRLQPAVQPVVQPAPVQPAPVQAKQVDPFIMN